jgi:glycosyltransferase involved in cell wall biosynthesis
MVVSDVSKPKLLMLAPHEPTLDPRVHYTAQSLAKKFDVVLFATIREFERRPEENYPENPAYTTHRAILRKGRTMAMGFEFAKIAIPWLLGSPPTPITSAIAAALVALASLMLGALGLVALVLEIGAIVIAAPLVLLVRTLRALRPVLMVTPSCYAAARDALGQVLLPFRSFLRNLGGGVQVSASVFRYTFAANATLLESMSGRAEGAEYIYCHDLYCLQAAVITKLKSGGRIIYDSHEYYPYLYRYPIFTWLTRLYERILVHFVDIYVTVSPQLAEELKRDYQRRTVVVIPNVEPRPEALALPADAALSEIAGGRLKLLYQGVFAEGRGLEEAITEWRNVDGARAAFFLRGPPNPVRDKLEALAQKLGLLGKSVFFLPPVLERDLISAAGEADLGLIPYKGDTKAYRFACPNKLSQYLHAGLGIVANSIPFVRTMIDEHGIGVCYDIDQPQSFASAVNRLARDPAEVAHLRSRAAATARDIYHWEKYEDTLLASVAAT